MSYVYRLKVPEHRQGRDQTQASRDQGLQTSACMFTMFGRCVGVVRGCLYMFLGEVTAHVRHISIVYRSVYNSVYTEKCTYNHHCPAYRKSSHGPSRCLGWYVWAMLWMGYGLGWGTISYHDRDIFLSEYVFHFFFTVFSYVFSLFSPVFRDLQNTPTEYNRIHCILKNTREYTQNTHRIHNVQKRRKVLFAQYTC